MDASRRLFPFFFFRSGISSLNIFKKVKNAFTSFPSFTVRVTTVYLDLFHDDWYGHPLPYMTATFAYLEPEKNYGLFSGLRGAVFSMDSGTRSMTRGGRAGEFFTFARPARVHLLLSPPPTFNQPVVLGRAGKGSLLAGLVGGTGIGASIAKSNNSSTLGKAIDLGQLVYAALKHVLTLRFSVRDFWLDGATCRLLT